MDSQLDQRLQVLEAKIDRIEKHTRTTKNIMLWTAISSVVMLLLPIIGAIFIVPYIMNTVNSVISTY